MAEKQQPEFIHFNHWTEVPDDLWRWPNFTPKEIASNGDGSIIINFDALDKLQFVRNRILAPVYLNSAYRDPEYNRKVGGVSKSFHLQGKAFDIRTTKAFDIRTTNLNRKLLYAIAKEAGFTGFGFYKTFIHVDTGPKRVWQG